MDFQEYRRKYYSDPQPEPRFAFSGLQGLVLYYQDYPQALAFLEQVFGPPNYVEGEDTHGWRIGPGWLTVFPSSGGNPQNIEVPIYLQSSAEVDRLHAALLEAGATGEPPEDTLMYEPVHMAFATDPFGVVWMLVHALPHD